MDKAANTARAYGGRERKRSSIQWTGREGGCTGRTEITGRIKDVPGIALHLNRHEGRQDGRVPYAVMPTDADGAIIWQREPVVKGTGRNVEEADKLGIQALLRAANAVC